MPIVTGDLLAELLEPPELLALLELDADPELALEELLLEPPHPASNTAIAATATAIPVQALRLDPLIWTFSSQRSLRRLADTERLRTPAGNNTFVPFRGPALQTFAAIVCDVIVATVRCQGKTCWDLLYPSARPAGAGGAVESRITSSGASASWRAGTPTPCSCSSISCAAVRS